MGWHLMMWIGGSIIKQLSLASGFELSGKRTRKRVFLEEMDRVVPWAGLVTLIEPHYSGKSATGRPPFACELMLRIHFLQQWFGLSDPAMEEALYDVPLYSAVISIRAAQRTLYEPLLQMRGDDFYIYLYVTFGLLAAGFVAVHVGNLGRLDTRDSPWAA